MLYYTNYRLCQIMYINKPFGGIVVVMFGDPGQLSPIGANSLWIDICKGDDLYGFGLYQQFTDVIILEKIIGLIKMTLIWYYLSSFC